MPQSLFAFGFLLFTYFGAIGLFNPYAPLWFKDLGFSTVTIGLIATLQSLSRIGAPYAWSWAGDHSGRRVEVIRLAAGGAFLASLGLLGVESFVPVALVTLLLFTANGGVIPLHEAVLAQRLTTEGRVDAARYGRVRVWGSIGFLFTVLAAGFLLERTGIAAFPWVVVAGNALLLAAAFKLPSTRQDAVHEQAAPPALPVLRRPEVAWFFASVFFVVLAHVSQYAFFSLYLDSLGYGKTAVGLLWAVAVLAEIAFFWVQGRWFSRLTPSGWLLLVAGTSVVRFALTAALGQVAGVLVLAQALHAVTFAAHHVACIFYITRFFPERLRGRGQALYSILGYGLSGALGGVLGGWLIQAAGFASVFWAAAVSAALGLACTLRMRQALERARAR